MHFVYDGQKVHVNRDDEDWGRIAADGVVVDTGEDGAIVHIPSLGGGADVWCRFNELNPR